MEGETIIGAVHTYKHMNYTFTLSVPPPVNQTYRTARGVMYKTKIAREWEELAAYEMMSVFRLKHDSEEDIDITLNFYFERDRDIDSGIKILLDFLQTKIYKNDKQVMKLTAFKHEDKKNPRVVIDITYV